MLLQAHVNLRLNFTLSKCALILRQCNIVFEQLFREFNFVFFRSRERCLGKFKLL